MGLHVKSFPSARTSKVSGSTSSWGRALLWTISFLPIPRVFFTASTIFPSPYCCVIPLAAASPDTKAIDIPSAALGEFPYIGRISTGWGVGMDALGSPICAYAMVPPLIIISGLAPKRAGFQRHISASFPGSIDPTKWDMPWALAGFMVYLATYRLIRSLSSSLPSSGKAPSCFFILSAVCHVLVITSPTLPIAWESDDIMDMAPISCRISSAAIVSSRILDSANATSSRIFLSR
mmetsp:Transcript_31581/g.50739  ORF Transcript_31581/g.50739 Transcript_31581/m.50739 type:complete len:235 (-) Transcript_31581:1831-2535(-)